MHPPVGQPIMPDYQKLLHVVDGMRKARWAGECLPVTERETVRVWFEPDSHHIGETKLLEAIQNAAAWPSRRLSLAATYPWLRSSDRRQINWPEPKSM